jgi:hypothetical protein
LARHADVVLAHRQRAALLLAVPAEFAFELHRQAGGILTPHEGRRITAPKARDRTNERRRIAGEIVQDTKGPG